MAESGERISGRYRLIETVGSGGMGRVWLASDELLAREVAVKEMVLPHGLPEDEREQLVRRALREARSAARLSHPGIITVHDVAEHHGVPMIVMEYVRGASLAETIKSDGPLSPERVARIGLDVLDALDAAHSAGILHRDLKPGNVMLSGRRVVITDFGIARVAGDIAITQTGMLVGTPAYMSPEQARRDALTSASDLWSLGATLYAAVEGRAPFAGTGFVATLAQVLNGEPEPPVHAGPLAPILLAMLRKDPAERATPEQIVDALSELASTTRADTPRPAFATRLPAEETIVERLPSGRVFGRRGILLGGVGVLGLLAVPVTIYATRDTSKPVVSTPLTGHSHKADAVAFSPDGKTVVSGSWDQTVKLWKVPSGEVERTLTGHRGPVTSAAYAPDGRTFVTASWDTRARVWDVKTNTAVGDFVGHTDVIYGVAFTRDGQKLATAGKDKTVRIWNVASRESLFTIKGHTSIVYSVAFSPDGTLVASAGYDVTVRLWDVATGKAAGMLQGHTDEVCSVVFSPDGTLLATASRDGTVRLWDVGSRALKHTLTGHKGAACSLAFDPTGKTLYSGGEDGTIRRWDMATKRTTATLTGHTDWIDALSIPPMGGFLASASWDTTVRLWRL